MTLYSKSMCLGHCIQVSVPGTPCSKPMCLGLPLLKGDKVDSSDLRNILKNLGIELTEKEQERLLKTLPADGELEEDLWDFHDSLCFVGILFCFVCKFLKLSNSTVYFPLKIGKKKENIKEGREGEKERE